MIQSIIWKNMDFYWIYKYVIFFFFFWIRKYDMYILWSHNYVICISNGSLIMQGGFFIDQ